MASGLLVLGLRFALQETLVTGACVYRQLYRHCSEHVDLKDSVNRAARARETVHTYRDTRDRARTEKSGHAFIVPYPGDSRQQCFLRQNV
jgi:hypothetical protein